MNQPDNGYLYLQQKLKQLSGIDLAMYKDRQMVRRLSGYLQRLELPSFYALARRIERDEKALEQLKAFITINVTEFFRNPDHFETLKRAVLPELAAAHCSLRIWSAGCSIGAEPYSVAILLAELGLSGPHRILATDIDDEALAAARAGRYSEAHLKQVDDQRRQRFFRKEDGDRWAVDPALQLAVQFQRHDLLRDPYPPRQHLILCRNVMIYFTEEAKERVYRSFAEALVPGGYLLVGGTESLLNPKKYGMEAVGPFLYRRTEGELQDA